MSLGLYADVHVPRAVTHGLRARNVDILTAQEDGRSSASDAALMDRATELGRLIFTQDTDFLAESDDRLQLGQAFSGVVFASQTAVAVGQMINDLELIAEAGRADEFANRVTYLPLRG